MAVVINEFEVVPAPEAEAKSAEASDKAPAAAGPTARDIERVIERAIERGRRVRAH